MMHLSLRLAAPRQRLMALGLLAPLMLVCLSMMAAALWLRPTSLEAWALIAAAVYILKPQEIFSHFILALCPGGPGTEEIRACLEPALRDAKARLVLAGRAADDPLRASFQVDLVSWRWHTRLLVHSRLDKKQDLALGRELEKVFDARFSRFQRARIAIASFASQMALSEPVISNHVLIEVAARAGVRE